MGDPREPLEETRPAPTELGPDSVLISGESAQVVRNVLAKSAPGGERYRLLELLGRGAMGEVYLAVDTVLGREVAVKFASDPRRADLALRFLTEVQVTGGLDHPGVVRVHDFDVDREGRPFFTMKRIRGEPWSELLQKQSLQDRLEVFQRVAEAVAHAHSRGVLHRDLKPANVLVGEYGEVVVADWGLAKILDKAGGLPPGRQDGAGGSGPPAGGGEAPSGRSGGQGWPERRSVSSSRRGAPRRARPAPPRPGATLAGVSIGTPGYSAPEQLAGDAANAHVPADVYALGAILFECLLGRPAFTGQTGEDIFAAQVRSRLPRPGDGAPAELVAIARKALSLRPAERYANVGELLEDLDHWRGGFPVSAMPETRSRRAVKFLRRHPVAVSGTAAILVAAPVVLWVLALREASVRAERFQAQEDARAAAIGPIEEGLAAGEQALAAAEREIDGEDPRPERARARLRLARLFFDEIEARDRELAERYEERGPLIARERTLAARSFLVEARLELLAASDPRFSPGPPHRRAARVHGAALAALARAREFGLAGPELDEIENRARGAGTIRIRTEPPGAELSIRPLAESSTGGAGSEGPGELLRVSGDGERLTLDAGGYLLVASSPGWATCRLPIYLQRGEDRGREIAIPLVREEEIPPGFAYVPPGPYLAGEDPEFRWMDRGYFIATTEISWGEWEAYGNTLDPASRPRGLWPDGTSYDLWDLIRRDRPADWRGLPLGGVSAEDLEAYAAWLSARDARFFYRLPTEEEWERAARGADGRNYPWGDEWEPGRANHVASHAEVGLGVFELVAGEAWESGRSVFGLFHTSGNVNEWTFGTQGERRAVRGGSVESSGTDCRTTARFVEEAGDRWVTRGGRLVAIPRGR